MGLKRDDWLKIIAGAGLLGTGAGMAGIGPLAGLLGGTGEALAAGAKGASLAPSLMGPTTVGAPGAMGFGAGVSKALGGVEAMSGAMGGAQSLLAPQQQSPMPPPQMAQAPQQPGPQFGGYEPMPMNTQPGSMFLPGMKGMGGMGVMDEEIKRKLRAEGYPV